jgi:hypothetical protein
MRREEWATRLLAVFEALRENDRLAAKWAAVVVHRAAEGA